MQRNHIFKRRSEVTYATTVQRNPISPALESYQSVNRATKPYILHWGNGLFGKVLIIHAWVYYERETATELQTAFREEVEDYPAACKELVQAPADRVD